MTVHVTIYRPHEARFRMVNEFGDEAYFDQFEVEFAHMRDGCLVYAEVGHPEVVHVVPSHMFEEVVIRDPKKRPAAEVGGKAVGVPPLYGTR